MTEPEQTTAADLAGAGNRFELREAFLLRQDQLLATLGVGRSVGSHPVAIGDDSELNWKGMIESILPTRYRVSKGFAVDADGNRSDQIDLLIYDRHFSPVLLDVGEYLFVAAEAVFGALEVKQTIDRGVVEYASGKVSSVRSLTRTSAPVPYVQGEYRPKPLHRIIGGLLTMDSAWTPPLGNAFEAALQEFGGEGGLDIGCVLSAGSFEVDEHDKALTRSGPDTALIFFIMRLLGRLQRMASPPAIEFERYAASLGDDPP
ncbi:MAG: DUF6602 domain-containing protein [Actinomycetota bacterium]